MKLRMISFLAGTALAGAATFAALTSAGAADRGTLNVVSWGGAYTKSQIEAYHRPFEAANPVTINSIDYNGGIAEVKAQVDSGNVVWDVVDFEAADALRACDEGLLEPIDVAALPAAPDGTSAADDFVADAANECWVATIIFSTIVAYDADKYGANAPTKIEDFFDLENFPGKRGLRRQNPKATLEMALMADGVAPADVYAMLATEEGLARAFAKLDTIKDSVVWWEPGSQPAQLLADGEVVMTTAYNGRIFNAMAMDGKPFKILWDGQIQELDVYSIVKGAPNMEAAKAFLAFATSTGPLAAQASWIAYAPARRSSLPLVGNHAERGFPMMEHMPTANSDGRALMIDNRWWADHQDDINERWSAWLAN